MSALVALLLLGDVYVDHASGDDANDGRSATSAFRSFQRAVAALKPGDVLHLAKTAEPYRERLVLEVEGVTVEGGGATISGLDPVDPALWKEREPGLLVARLQPARPQAQIHVDGEPMEYESTLEEIEPGRQVWGRHDVHLMLPEGKRWPGPAIALLARVEGVVIRAPKVVVKNLTIEQIGGSGVRVSGAASAVRLENVEVRLCRWGDSAGLHLTDEAQVAMSGGRLSGNASGAVALRRASLSMSGVTIENNRHFGVRASGPEASFEDCRFTGNGTYDVSIRALDPESANGGGPARGRALRCVFATGAVVDGEDPPARLELEACVFLKGSLKRQSGTLLAKRNLYGGTAFETEGSAVDFAAWGDATSRWEPSIPAEGPWSLDGAPVGPRR